MAKRGEGAVLTNVRRNEDFGAQGDTSDLQFSFSRSSSFASQLISIARASNERTRVFFRFNLRAADIPGRERAMFLHCRGGEIVRPGAGETLDGGLTRGI